MGKDQRFLPAQAHTNSRQQEKQQHHPVIIEGIIRNPLEQNAGKRRNPRHGIDFGLSPAAAVQGGYQTPKQTARKAQQCQQSRETGIAQQLQIEVVGMGGINGAEAVEGINRIERILPGAHAAEPEVLQRFHGADPDVYPVVGGGIPQITNGQ